MSTVSLPTWRILHTGLVVIVTGFFLWMGIVQPWGLYRSWVTLMPLLALFTVVVGHGTTGVWKGAFVDGDNRMSLSRVQIFAWTVVILPAMAVIAIGRTAVDPATALDFNIPQTVWLLLGISTVSFLGAPVIKEQQRESQPSGTVSPAGIEAQGYDSSTTFVTGAKIRNLSVGDARLSDLFTSETYGAGRLDLSRIQMFFFTILTVLSYAVAVGMLLRSGAIPGALPDVGDGMVMVLGISHAGYLGSKALPGTRS